ncbi:MAG: hypothetical protein KDB61_03115 [Planctomycetes bacterium]|nr:hypothetical protein [Planctomycetota bacterium]
MRNLSRFSTRACLLALGLVLPVTGGCVTLPKPEEVLAYGFETPVQTFQSFVVALRADLPNPEYDCFSAGFKERNQVSRLGYHEFRAQLLKDQPLLRWALQKAARKPEAYILEPLGNGDRVHMIVDVSGHVLHVLLVRDSYVTVMGQPDDPLNPAEAWVDQTVSDLFDDQWIFPMPNEGYLGAQVPHPGRDLRQLVSITVGREWKIDDLYLEGEAQP